jgi:hypothetical protein
MDALLGEADILGCGLSDCLWPLCATKRQAGTATSASAFDALRSFADQ